MKQDNATPLSGTAETRELSGVEKLVWMITRRVPLNFAVVARIRGEFSTDDLRSAAALVRTQYKGLASRIARNEQGALCYTGDDVPDFPVTELAIDTDDAWRREVERELAEPFEGWVGPLARFVVLRHRDYVDLLVVCDHGVADGLSAVNLLRDVCRRMVELDAPVVDLPRPQSAAALIPPEVRQQREVIALLRWGPKALWLLSKLDRCIRFFTRKAPPSIEPYAEFPRPEDLRGVIEKQGVRLTTWFLPHEQLKSLVDRCRAEQTTVHAALCVAWARAAYDLDPKGKGAKRIIESPINIRPRLKPAPEEGAGLYNLLANVNADARLDFWQAAREFRRGLDKATTDTKLLSGVLFIEHQVAKNDETELRRMVAWLENTKSKHCMSISNLGRVRMPTDFGPFQIEQVHGPCVIGRGGVPVIGVATHNDRLTFSLTEDCSAIDLATSQATIRTAMRHLAEACGWQVT